MAIAPNQRTSSPSITTNSLLILIVAGSLLGLSTILAKLAPLSGLAPSALLTWSITGAAIILFLINVRSVGVSPARRDTIGYLVVAATLGVAGPNLLIFSSVEHVGANFAALALSFPPLLTYVAAVSLRIERLDARGTIGILFALGGAGLIAWLNVAASAIHSAWILATLVAPILLAAGNIYRSLRWPVGAKPGDLAPGMLIGASIILIIAVAIAPELTLAVPPTAEAVGLVAIQTASFAVQFRLFFILQQQAGPVMVSLLGSVGAIVAVPVAVGVLHESVPETYWVGASLISLGVFLVVARTARRARKTTTGSLVGS